MPPRESSQCRQKLNFNDAAAGLAQTAEPRWRRLKELEKERARLKKLVAEQALDMDMLKEVARVKW